MFGSSIDFNSFSVYHVKGDFVKVFLKKGYKNGLQKRIS